MINLERPENTKLRILNDQGLIKFKNAWDLIYVDFDKNNGLNLSSLVENLPQLYDDLSYEIEDSPIIKIKDTYKNRYYLSDYLVGELDDFINQKKLFNEYGFWGWLSLAHILILTNNFNKVSMWWNYIPDAGINKKSGYSALYRHAIRESYILNSRFKEESKIYFHRTQVETQGDFWESSRGFALMRNNNSIHKYFVKKFSDPDGSGYAKRGASAILSENNPKSKESLRRVGPNYKRVSVSYAAPLLNEEELGNLLGPGLEI